MIDPTEEQLMGFADGELDAETERWVAALVAQRPDLARKVAIYRATGRGLGETVAKGIEGRADGEALAARIMSHPLPGKADTARGETAPKNEVPRITPVRTAAAANGAAKADAGKTGAAPNGGATVVQFPGRGSKRGGSRSFAPNFAVAASLTALVVGALAMTAAEWQASRPPVTTMAGKSIAGSGLSSAATALAVAALGGALETTPSLQRVVIDGGWTVEPVLTFAAKDGRYCREYTAVHGAGSAVNGVACRSAPREWEIRQQAAIAPPRTAGADGVSRPASAGAKPVEMEIRRLQDKDALSPDDEARVIAGGWK